MQKRVHSVDLDSEDIVRYRFSIYWLNRCHLDIVPFYHAYMDRHVVKAGLGRRDD